MTVAICLEILELHTYATDLHKIEKPPDSDIAADQYIVICTTSNANITVPVYCKNKCKFIMMVILIMHMTMMVTQDIDLFSVPSLSPGAMRAEGYC